MSFLRVPFVTLALVLGLSACTGGGAAPDPDPAPSVLGDLVPTTARGLAAAVLTHLDAEAVTTVGGTDRGGEVSVFVETDDPDVESVHVSLYPAAGLTCGADHGYDDVSCSMRPALRNVVGRRSDGGRMPVLMGRFEDQARDGVLVQVFGSGSPDAVRLVEALLDDPLVGRWNSSALEADGQDLEPFEDLVRTIRLRPDPGADRSGPLGRTGRSASPAPR